MYRYDKNYFAERAKKTGFIRDNLKVEINYSMRDHVLQISELPARTDFLEKSFPVKVLSPLELFGGKINALIGRTAAKDLYDVDNMIYYGIFNETELPMLKKCFLFYYAIGSSKKFDDTFELSGIDNLNRKEIKKALIPVLRRSEHFDLEAAKKRVKSFLTELLALDAKEVEFLRRFKKKEYIPELLFDDTEVIERVKAHPMALWKIRR